MKFNDIVSIIIPIYNSEKNIKKCLESIINQTYTNLEIILIDDGSTDNSIEVCQEYKDDRIKVYKEKNSGPSTARNLGLKQCNGNYIVFVDSDDYIEKNMIEIMLKEIKSDDYDICICGYYLVSNSLKKKINITINDNKNFKEIVFDYKNNVYGYLWNKMLKKNIIEKKFREDISICEDELFLLDNSNYIKKITFVKEPLYNYISNESSLINSCILSDKKISELDALIYIVNANVNRTTNNIKKCMFIHKYIYFLGIANKEQRRKIINKYKKTYLKYYKEILKSEMPLKTKITAITRRRCFYMYKLYKFLKRRK